MVTFALPLCVVVRGKCNNEAVVSVFPVPVARFALPNEMVMSFCPRCIYERANEATWEWDKEWLGHTLLEVFSGKGPTIFDGVFWPVPINPSIQLSDLGRPRHCYVKQQEKALGQL